VSAATAGQGRAGRRLTPAASLPRASWRIPPTGEIADTLGPP